MFDFIQCILHAESDDIIGIGSSAGEAGAEFSVAGGHDEEIGEGGLDFRVFTGSHEGSSLHVDIHDDIDSF